MTASRAQCLRLPTIIAASAARLPIASETAAGTANRPRLLLTASSSRLEPSRPNSWTVCLAGVLFTLTNWTRRTLRLSGTSSCTATGRSLFTTHLSNLRETYAFAKALAARMLQMSSHDLRPGQPSRDAPLFRQVQHHLGSISTPRRPRRHRRYVIACLDALERVLVLVCTRAQRSGRSAKRSHR